MLKLWAVGGDANSSPIPVKSLFDRLEAGVPLDEYLDDFSTVSKEKAIALLDIANKLLTSKNVKQLYAAFA